MIRPLRDLLVIEPEKAPGMIGLIHVPDRGDSGNKTGCICRVVAAGPQVELAKVGRSVLVQAYGAQPAGDQVSFDGRTLTLIRERDIDGVVEE